MPIPGITVRPATPEDYGQIRRITVDSYRSAGYFDSPDHPYLAVLADVEHRARHADVRVAERDGQIIGALAIVEPGGHYADVAVAGELEFRMLAVDPAVQRSGAGRAMVEAVISYARSRPEIDAVSLTSLMDMTAAHRLYESLGFSRVPKRDWVVPEEDIQLLVFRLPLR